MDRPDLYRYLDFRAYLRDWYEARRRDDPGFSKRGFARLAGKSSPGLLSEVMDGERQLTGAMVGAFANALGLSRPEADFFDALVQFDQATDTRARRHAWERISAVRAFQEARPIETASAQYLSHWWFPVVRELAHRADFDPDPAWIAKRVRPQITEAQARRALEVLRELRLLEPDATGRLRPSDVVVSTPHEVEGLAVHDYHRGMLERAIESIDRFPQEDRHLLAATVSVPHALIETLKAELNGLQERILDLSSRFDGPPEEVLQVHLVMFPLSDRGRAEGR
ncbi:MAG: TIGR02147 family protein [Myxococcota bacterium]